MRVDLARDEKHIVSGMNDNQGRNEKCGIVDHVNREHVPERETGANGGGLEQIGNELVGAFVHRMFAGYSVDHSAP